MLREAHGNPRKTKIPTDIPEGRGGLWAPPAWLDDEQRAQWDYALEHAPHGLLTGTDREVLAVWVCASVEYARAVLQVRQLGQVVKTKDGNAIQSPFVGVMNRQAFIMLRAGADMGFSPASRMALALIPRDEGGSRYIGAARNADTLDDYLAMKPDTLQ